jgi:hypothetical protein
MCNRSNWRRLRRGKHLPFSHVNRVVLMWRRGLFLALSMLTWLGRSELLQFIRPNDVTAESRLGFDRRLKENHPDVLFTAPNHAAETLALAHADNQGESIRNSEMRPDLKRSPRQGQVGNSAVYRGDTKSDRSDP